VRLSNYFGRGRGPFAGRAARRERDEVQRRSRRQSGEAARLFRSTGFSRSFFKPRVVRARRSFPDSISLTVCGLLRRKFLPVDVPCSADGTRTGAGAGPVAPNAFSEIQTRRGGGVVSIDEPGFRPRKRSSAFSRFCRFGWSWKSPVAANGSGRSAYDSFSSPAPRRIAERVRRETSVSICVRARRMSALSGPPSWLSMSRVLVSRMPCSCFKQPKLGFEAVGPGRVEGCWRDF